MFFSIPGLGREVLLAVNRSDYPVIQAITVYLAALTMVINLPMQAPASGRNLYGSQDGLRRFYQTAQREIEREPGIRSVAWGGALPLDGMWSMQPFTVAGDTPSEGRATFASYHMESPG